VGSTIQLRSPKHEFISSHIPICFLDQNHQDIALLQVWNCHLQSRLDFSFDICNIKLSKNIYDIFNFHSVSHIHFFPFNLDIIMVFKLGGMKHLHFMLQWWMGRSHDCLIVESGVSNIKLVSHLPCFDSGISLEKMVASFSLLYWVLAILLVIYYIMIISAWSL